MELPPSATFNIDNQSVGISAFDAREAEQSLHQQAVNIIASGPSIADLAFADLVDVFIQ